jgi:hypothetical protein
VLPVLDLVEHVESGTCWCQPTIAEELGGGRTLVVHWAFNDELPIPPHYGRH